MVSVRSNVDYCKSLDKVLADVASHFDTFQPLANVMRSSQLSEQAVSVLRQLNQANSSAFLEIEMMSNNQYSMLDKSGTIDIIEPRFIDDDLMTLCEFNLLRLSHNSNGDRMFTITRSGAAVGEKSE